MSLPYTFFLDIIPEFPVNLILERRTALDAELKARRTLPDPEPPFLAAVALTDTDFRVKILQQTLLF